MSTSPKAPPDLFKPKMGVTARVLGAWGAGIRLTFTNHGIALAAALPVALLSAVLDSWVEGAMPGGTSDQSALIKVFFAWTGINLALEVIYGPVLAAMAVYVMTAWSRGQATSVYKAVNFALNRYRRQFLPHMGAWLSIMLGMMVLIPGIYFLCMYAFVDPVACLEDEKWAMARSKDLTRGRRKTIFLVALPWIVLGQVFAFLELVAMEKGMVWLFLSFWAYYVLGFGVYVAYTWLYLERTTPRKAASAG